MNNKQNGHQRSNGTPKKLSLIGNNGHGANGNGNGNGKPKVELVSTPLLPEGFYVPSTRFAHPSIRMRRLMET